MKVTQGLILKRLKQLTKEAVKNGFNKQDLIVITDKQELQQWLKSHSYQNTNILLMSSGNYDGLNVVEAISQS